MLKFGPLVMDWLGGRTARPQHWPLFLPAHVTAPHRWCHHIAIVAVLTVALTYTLSRADVLPRDLPRIAEVLAVLLTSASAWQIARTDSRAWMYLLPLVLVAWMLTVEAVAAIAPDEPSVDRFQRSYARQYLFLVGGWWLGRRRVNAYVLLAAGAVGILATLLALSSVDDWMRAWNGARVDFGFHNAQHTALNFGSLLILGALIGAAAWRLHSRTWRIVAATTAIVLGALCFFVLEATGTRQTWVALAAALVAAIALLWRDHFWKLALNRRKSLIVIIVSIAILAWLNPFGGAWERTLSEAEQIRDYISGEAPQSSSTNIRLLQWQLAAARIVERPLTGYGAAAGSHLIAASDLPDFAREGFGHFHNSYLDITLRYGIVALMLWLVAMGAIGRQIIRAYKERDIGPAYAGFAMAWLVFYLCMNLFESYVQYDSSHAVVLVFGGAIYGATMRVRSRGSKESAIKNRRDSHRVGG